MEVIQSFLVSSLFALIIISLFAFLKSKKRHNNNNLPPGPSFISTFVKKFPIPASELLKLSNKYGPIMSFWVGSRHLSFVVSSPSLAKEFFTTNDVVLANRPKLLVNKHIGYNYTTQAASSYGPHWQNIHRIYIDHLLTPCHLNNSNLIRIRKEEIGRLLSKLTRRPPSNACQDNVEEDDGFKRVEFSSMFWEMSFYMLVRMMTGQGHEYCNKKVKHFREITRNLHELGGFGEGNIIFPNLFKSDFEKKVVSVAKKLDIFFQTLIDEQRIGKKEAGCNHQPQPPYMITDLLNLQESNPDGYPDEMIKGFIADTLIVPLDSLSVTLQWAIATLLNNPEVLKKAKEEIDDAAQVGGDDKVLGENDFAKLHYLQSIIWEIFRLYPSLPLLIPHKSSDECSIGGYCIPRGTMAVVNVYAIHRDPKSWDDPNSFKPERFDKENIDKKETYKLLQFGAGRRACPGARLSNRIMGLCLGSMIQCFEWKQVSEAKVDMTEREEGVHLVRTGQLEAMCKARPIINKILKEIE